MKKIIACLALLVGLIGNAWGQYQVGNSDFESWGSDENEPGSGWYSFPSARTDDLSVLARMFAISGSKANTEKLTGQEARNGGTSVRLKSRYVGLGGSLGANANGNLTTGKINMGATEPIDSKNYNYTARGTNNCCLFSGRPDAVEFWYRYTRGESGDYMGYCHLMLHGDINYKDPYESDANIRQYRIAEAEVYAAPAADWSHAFTEFTYDGVESDNSYILVNFTTNKTPGASKGDIFDIDDIRFIYYSQLKSLSVDGVSVPNFNKDVYEYTVNSFYKEGVTSINAIDNTKAGVATINQNQADGFGYDAESTQYKIKVTNQEGTESHTYTIQFKQYEANLTAATYNGAAVSFTNGAASVDQFYDESKLALTVSEQATVTKSFDQATQKLTITVKSGNFSNDNLQNTYTIQFKQYTYAMTSVTYNGLSVTADANGIYQVDEYYDKYDASKLVPVGSDEEVTFEKSAMNAETQNVTVTAKSGNYANDHNSTTYTFKFKDYFAILEATYDGKTVVFSKSNTAIVDAFYEASKLILMPSDQATTALSMDEQTQLLTITVTSGDGKKTETYTIQFKQYEAEIVSATYNGNAVTFTNRAAEIADARWDPSKLTVTPSEGATHTVSYNSANYLVTIIVTGGNGNSNTYTIQFPSSFTYTLEGVQDGQTEYWGTFCYPGAVTSIEGAEVYSILGKDKNTNPSYISLQKVTSFPLDAGMPYIYLTTEDEVTLVTDATYKEVNNISGNPLRGVYEETKPSTSSNYTYMILNNTIVKIDANSPRIAANRAWINTSPSLLPVYTGTGNQIIPFSGIKKGDVNLDGSVTIADVTALVNIILGKNNTVPYLKSVADVSGDGNVTITDVKALVNIVLGIAQE